MKTFKQICRQLVNGEFDFSRHALKRAVERNISEQEIREAAGNAQIIEEYPEDKYSPSCLIFGQTKTQRPLQVSFADTENVRIITLYEPDPAEWIDFIERR